MIGIMEVMYPLCYTSVSQQKMVKNRHAFWVDVEDVVKESINLYAKISNFLQ